MVINKTVRLTGLTALVVGATASLFAARQQNVPALPFRINNFEIKDKTGRKIHLSDERWNHIVTEHPELANKIEEIKEILLNPLIIGRSKNEE